MAAKRPMPEPPDASGVMNALTIIGSTFEQIERQAGTVAAEVVAYQAEYREWQKDVEQWRQEHAG